MASHEGRQVLVVEDDLSVRAPLVKFLQLHGFEARWAGTAGEALAEVASRPPHAAVVDLRLPGGSGRDVVLAIPPPIPVIIFSGAPTETLGLERLRPATRLIVKPFSLTMLVEMLEAMLAEETEGKA